MFWRGKKPNLFYLVFPLLIFIICVSVKIIPALYGNISADACGYLDITRNLLKGKGLVVSFNLYQYWAKETYYPALPYMQFLFSIAIAPVYFVFKSVAAVNIFNVFLAGINVLLLYKLLVKRYSLAVTLWSAILVGISPTMQYTSVLPWSEQLHLLLLLASLVLLVDGLESQNNHKIFFAGAIMGVNCLVRIANVYAILAFALTMLFLRGSIKGYIRKMLIFILGVVIFIVPYEIFCILKYGEFYPSYLKVATVFRASEVFPGTSYAKAKPVLMAPVINNITRFTLFVNYVFYHLWEFIRELRFISLFILSVGLWVFFRKRILEIFLFILGMGTVLCYSLNLYWLPEVETFRYSLIPEFSFLPLIVAFADDGFGLISKNFLKRHLNFVFIGVVLVIYFDFFLHLHSQNQYFSNKDVIREKRNLDFIREDVFGWVRREAGADELIATDLIQNIFFLDRPAVSLPVGEALTPDNFKRYLSIYRPKCIVTANPNIPYFLNEEDYRLGMYKYGLWVFIRD